jgi:hypothetical protein
MRVVSGRSLKCGYEVRDALCRCPASPDDLTRRAVCTRRHRCKGREASRASRRSLRTSSCASHALRLLPTQGATAPQALSTDRCFGLRSHRSPSKRRGTTSSRAIAAGEGFCGIAPRPLSARRGCRRPGRWRRGWAPGEVARGGFLGREALVGRNDDAQRCASSRPAAGAPRSRTRSRECVPGPTRRSAPRCRRRAT